MPEIIETTVYRFDQLPNAAKDTARAWYREQPFHYDWPHYVYKDFERISEILGIALDTFPVPLLGGGSRTEPCIWFTGFWNQGDGACFEGSYAYQKAASENIRRHAPKEGELHRIADALREIQRRDFYQLHARIKHRGLYHHRYTMAIEVERHGPTDQDVTEGVEDGIRDLLRDLALWLYRQLEQEYDYLASDEAVNKALIANDDTFTEDGCRFG